MQRIEIENRMWGRRVELVNLETMTEYIADMQAVLRGGTLVERKAFIRSFVKDIRVSGNDAVLIYSVPELPEKVSLEEAGVPRIVQHGGRYWTRTSDLCDDMQVVLHDLAPLQFFACDLQSLIIA